MALPLYACPSPLCQGGVLDNPLATAHSATMKTVLTFGDSNTHGMLPLHQRSKLERYDRATRWPGIVAQQLGCPVIEEGLPGRTTAFDDPVMDGIMNGYPALRQALQSHAPIDVLTIMLGTNDCKTRFAASPEKITGGIAALLDLALSDEMQARNQGFKLLLIAPVPLQEAGVLATEFWGGAAKSNALAPMLQALAQTRGIAFLDAGQHARVSPVDGVHLDESAHYALGTAIAQTLATL